MGELPLQSLINLDQDFHDKLFPSVEVEVFQNAHAVKWVRDLVLKLAKCQSFLRALVS